MRDIAFQSASKLAGLIKRKKLGCVELLEHFLARVEKYNPALNAIIATDIPRAQNRAKAADTAVAKGEIWGPLHGVPMTVKESHRVAGLPTTWGVPALKDNISGSDGLTVQRWLDAGVTLFGKTNIPLMLSDLQSWNEIYGTTNNPWDDSKTPGGSSGGAAAAVAAGLSGIEMGSDIASSIRNPAHYCNIFGHKPTYGLCPPLGHGPFETFSATDISCVGPLARSADDLALGLRVMAGPDAIEAEGYRLRLPPPRKKKLADFKVAFMDDHPLAPVDNSVKDLLHKLAAFLGAQGANVDSAARPDFDIEDGARTYNLMVAAAMQGRVDDQTFAENKARAEALDSQNQSVVAQMQRGAVLHHRDWILLNEKRHRMRWQWHEFFKSFDVMLCPVLCTAAFPHDPVPPLERMISVNGQSYPAMTEIFWAGLSGLFYLPASVAPIGFTNAGLPVGVQIIAPQYHDRMSIHFARLLEKEYHAYTPPPGFE